MSVERGRIVSLVPSLTETVAALGAADRLVGVTTYCVRGAPEHAVRVGGSKYPDVAAVLALRPDLVLANTEENQTTDLDELRRHGVAVLETFPRTVADVPDMLRRVGAALGAAHAAEQFAREVAAAADQPVPHDPVPAATLIWRKPWMAVGGDSYIHDLLGRCGFRNVLADPGGALPRYPKVDAELFHERRPVVVLLPSEPWEFTDDDLPAVRELVGPGPLLELVDGQLLSWHGHRTAEALRRFRSLAASLASADYS